VPQAFASLRAVPLYADFIQERFERCLDLYLCPRVRKKRLFVDPESLVPQLPKPRDLQPFPTQLAVRCGALRCAALRPPARPPARPPGSLPGPPARPACWAQGCSPAAPAPAGRMPCAPPPAPHPPARRYTGHSGRVRSVSADPSGQWLASGGDDGTLRLWEVATGRCMRTWHLGAPVVCVAWCPAPATRLLAAAADKAVLLLPSGVGGEAVAAAAAEALRLEGGEVAGELATWRQRPDGGVEIAHRHVVRHLAWHARGDYFSSVAPTGATQVRARTPRLRGPQLLLRRPRGCTADPCPHDALRARAPRR
jgi:hypothetical protein